MSDSTTQDIETPEPLSPVVTEEQVREIAKEFGTPVYVYSQKLLEHQADLALKFPNAFGLTVRYAMKASPNRNILRIFQKKGLYIDASSGFEARRAMKAGIDPWKIQLTGQEIPKDLEQLILLGVKFNACSLHQLKTYGRIYERSGIYGIQSALSVRINPGLGSGHNNRTNTGGESSPFGIWHEQIPEVVKITEDYGLEISRVHTHIGSGSDPNVWQKVALMSLDIVKRFLDAGHEVERLNLGGGYKIARMTNQKATDLQKCGNPVKEAFERFAEETGVKLRLEIEPGTYLVGNSACVIATAKDIKSTPGYNFIVTDSGMTEVTRPALYGAQHPISVVPRCPDAQRGLEKYLVFGHCCESGDTLTPKDEDPEGLMPRLMQTAKIEDPMVIGGAGAYCSGMSTKNYNSFPEAPEVLIDHKGEFKLIKRRQTLQQMIENEIDVVRQD